MKLISCRFILKLGHENMVYFESEMNDYLKYNFFTRSITSSLESSCIANGGFRRIISCCINRMTFSMPYKTINFAYCMTSSPSKM